MHPTRPSARARARALVVVPLLVAALLGAACGRSGSDSAAEDAAPGTGGTSAAADCAGQTPEATDVGITADTITIEVMADTGSPLAPGLFQANIDAMKAYADHVNAEGGLACRKLVVKTWDTKLTPEEAKNGQIDACANAFALVGGNSLFNPDVTTMDGCPDLTGAATGLPDIAALANDVAEMCSPLTYNIQVVSETCPVTPGQVRPVKGIVGPMVKSFIPDHPGLHGVFAVPGDLPSTVQSAMPQIAAQEQAGVVWDDLVKVSGRDEQTAWVPKIQTIKSHDSTYVYNGSGDTSMATARKEAAAQGTDTVDVWACALGCYSKKLLDNGGEAVEGTYVWMQFLPFEEKDTNAELAAYLDGVGEANATSFGAQAWQAGVLFRTAVQAVVDADGINGLTRASLLEALDGIQDFTANGWMGAKDLKGVSDCFVLLQVRDGAFQRVFPTERGTLDCDPANVVTVDIDPAAEATARVR